MRKWIPIIILASGQFVMTLDTSVMNVSISQITADLNTSIQGVQAAITLYALVMAALMLTGAKLGDIYGRNRMFAIGLAVYGVGSLITALSPSLPVLLVGWSGIEGLGAIMVIPGIAALTAANYEGKDRALAYALIGGITAVAVAAGPLIGGWVTTNASWRYVFAGETVIVTVIILLRGQIAQAPKAEHRPKLDVIGSVLSVAGLGLAVFGILMGSKWGFVKPLGALTIDGTKITPLGFSMVPFMVLAGLGILAGFVQWEDRRERLGLDRLLDTRLDFVQPHGISAITRYSGRRGMIFKSLRHSIRNDGAARRRVPHQKIPLHQSCDNQSSIRHRARLQKEDRFIPGTPLPHSRHLLRDSLHRAANLAHQYFLGSLSLERSRDFETRVSKDERVFRIPLRSAPRRPRLHHVARSSRQRFNAHRDHGRSKDQSRNRQQD